MSSFYWHDRFIMEQARSNHPSTESGRTNTIEHISTALQLFRLSHNPIICVTNWGLITASNRVSPEPILYRQHLPTFPAPFDNHQSYHQDPPFNTPTHVDNEWKSRATFTITHHITLGIPLVNEQPRPGVQIAGLIRTSGNPRLAL
ncbi:hypothetical protein BD779DRAFT_24765 [Infundibulicybe gibba]|nr:hypothetical protein BD779DRAFT_24765 [Infundibulicybe gibba]